MKNKKQILLLFFVCAVLLVNAQVHFSGNPVAMGRNADALLSINAISNYSKPMVGDIVMEVTEEGSDHQVLTIIFQNITVVTGINRLSKYSSQAARRFYDNELSKLLKSNGNFPPGNYSICCLFNPADKLVGVVEKEHCFSNTVTARQLLSLIEPADSICNYRPSFTWIGRKTQGPNVAFQVVCSEIKDHQSAEEALVNNPPVIKELLYMQANQMAYPAGASSLKTGKKYAWQVTEVSGNSMLNSSEVNVFNVGCKEFTETTVESFAEVKSFQTGKKYYFTDAVNFSFDNAYSEKKLNYTITQGGTLKKLENIPEIKIATGLNKISIDVGSLRALQKGQLYTMKIYNVGPAVYYLNFIVKE